MPEIAIVGAGVRPGVDTKGAPARKPDGMASAGFGAILAAALGLASPAVQLPQAPPALNGEVPTALVPEGPATADPNLCRDPALMQARAVPVPEAATSLQLATVPSPVTPGLIGESPGFIRESPGFIRESPGLIRESPGLIRESPGLIRESPGLIRESPGFISESPGLIRESPGLIREFPGLIRESPGLIRESPGLIRESPGPLTATPAPVRGPAPPGLGREQKRPGAVALSGGGNQVFRPLTLPPDPEVPRTDPPPTPIAPHELIERVVKSVAKSPDGSYHLSVQLHPEHLGEVRLHVVVAGKEVQTLFLVESPDAGQALSQQGEQLRQGLQQAGLVLGGFQVETGSGGDSPQGRQTASDDTEPGRPRRQRLSGDQTGIRSIGPATRSNSRPGGLDTMA